MNWEYILYGDWPSGILLIIAIWLVCWLIESLQGVKWPWQKF
jgi:hypothetical protein